MAIIKNTPELAQFFASADPYRWDVDNRPLANLLDNDIAINSELEAIRSEVIQARTGLLSVYPSLDARLDAMESSIGASVSISDVEDLQGHQYGDFISNSEAVRRAAPSGFLDHNGIADLSVGDLYDDFSGIRTTSTLGAGYADTVVLWTGWGSQFRPIRTLVNGWVVRLFNEKLGTPPTTPSNHVTVHLGSAASTGKLTNFVFLEVWLQEIDKAAPVFYKYGAVNTNDSSPTVTDHLHPDVIHTVKAMATGGNWIQLRHRLRFAQDIDPTAAPDGFSTSILAQGGKNSPVTSYPFSNMNEMLDDAGLWRAGTGSTGDSTALGTYDGFVYAIPIMQVHRRNSGNYAVTNQNGTRIDGVSSSGYLSSSVSGRPDGLFYDAVDQRDILDMRHKVSLAGADLQSVLDRTWQMLVRGELRTNWKQLVYDYDNNGVYEGSGVWGHTLTPIDEIANTALASTNPARDRQVTGAPLALPDGQRIFWGKTATLQTIKFTFTQGTNGSASPSGFLTYNSSTETLTFNAATLSGAGTGGTKIGISSPIIMQKTSLGTQPTIVATGLGTQTSTAKLTGLTPATQYVGYIQVVYPGGSGVTYPHKKILYHEVYDNGLTKYPSEQFGTTGVPGSSSTALSSPRGIAKDSAGNYIVADCFNARIVKINPSTWTITAQFGTGAVGSDNTHCNTPNGVTVDSSDNIYFCDSGNHRVVKLNSSMTYLAQFGVTGVSGADNSHCRVPDYIATDGTYLYVADQQNHRLIKLTLSMTYSSQFGSTGVVGAGKFGLSSPYGVAVANAGFGTAIWVSDVGNKRIVILDSSLNFKYQIGNQTTSNTLNTNSLTDVALDSSGNFYISDGTRQSVYKYSSSLSLLAQFGTDNVPGSDNSHCSKPSGIAIDEANGWLYVADSFNHRVLRLSMSNLAYVGQFGVTGVTTGLSLNLICSGPADVAVDGAGNLYIAENNVHCVTKVNTSLVLVARFGWYGVAQPVTSTNGLRNPLGVAVNTAGTIVKVVDAGNLRIVKLNGSLTYISYYQIVYNTTAISRQITNIYDIEYSASDGLWYVPVAEVPLGSNTTDHTFAVCKFTDTPSGTPNYSDRFTSYDWPVGIFTTATKVYGTTESHGLIIHDKATPTNYEYTSDPTVSIYFNIISPCGLYSDGSRVLVAEPSLNTIHCFDADIAVYRGSAGVLYEAGDDDARINFPAAAMIHGKYLLVSDTNNHRLLRRHISSPWVATSGTISTMLPPVGADRVRIFYEADTYQGVLGQYGGGEAVWKSQVKGESVKIYATTLGLGSPISTDFDEFKPLRGMTTRLPLPSGLTDFSLNPLGMKVGTDAVDDDGPYLALPVVISEGFMGGQINVTQEGGSSLSSRQVLQQIVRTIKGTESPVVRGFRTVLPNDTILPANATDVSIFTPQLPNYSATTNPNDFKIIRRGSPRVGTYNLFEAVPHFTYYPFLYQRKGRLIMAVIAQFSSGKDVKVGGYEANAVDGFYPPSRILIR